MKRYAAIVAISVLLAAGPVAAQNSAGTTSGPSSQDQAFLRHAAVDGATEVAINKEALAHVQSPAAKKMAQRLIDDHTKANSELADVAKRNNVTVSAEPDPTQLASAKSWASMRGTAYDQAYAQAMVDDHQKAIQLFTEGTRSTNAQISQFARNTLPTLEDHLSMATELTGGQPGKRTYGTP